MNTLWSAPAPLSALDAAGPAAAAIARVWWWMTGAGGMVLLGVCLLAAAAFLRRRSKPDARRAARLALAAGIALPLAAAAALLAWGLPAGQAMRAHVADAYRVEVWAHQWWWEVRYPDAPGGPVYSANELHIPAGRPVAVTLRSDDVIHSFWAPRLGGKLDAIPGRVNTVRLQADRPGVYAGTCAEFCGAQHARMGLRIEAHPPQALQARLAAAASPHAAAARLQAGPYARHCLGCHSLDPRVRGRDGPNLADLPLRLTLGAGTLDNTPEGLRRWLRDHRQLKPGSRMPPVALAPAELEALAEALEARP
ncbi:cytochrome c oxidase subunit II [Bordetella sp. 2513F-2]